MSRTKSSIMRRAIIPVSILLLSAALLSSCSFGVGTGSDQDLNTLVALNTGVNSFINLIATEEDTEAAAVSTRTINVGEDTGDDDDIYSILAGGTKAPQEIYTEYKASNENKAYIPQEQNSTSNQLISNFYGDPDKEAYFTMVPATVDGQDAYQIDLWVYDRSNLYHEYEFESYYVGRSDTRWAVINGTEPSEGFGFRALESHYYDGSVLSKEVRAMGYAGDVYDIAIPELTQSNLARYTFEITSEWDQTPALDHDETEMKEPELSQTGGSFYLQTHGTGVFPSSASSPYDYEVMNYYAESDDQNTRMGLSYLLQQSNASDHYYRTVTRSRAEYDDTTLESRLIRSVTVHSYKGDDPWHYYVQEITIDPVTQGNATVMRYVQEDKSYSYTLASTPYRHTRFDLEEQNSGGGTKRYAGTFQIFYTSWIENYSVRYDEGVFTLKQKKGSSRALIGDEFSIAMRDLHDGSSFSLMLPGGGSFTGRYAGGAFIGVYTAKGSAPQDIVIQSGAITLDGEPWDFVQ
jgi:hypothetical protein